MARSFTRYPHPWASRISGARARLIAAACRPAWLIVLAAGLVLGTPAGIARAALLWSQPMHIDEDGGLSLTAIACTNVTECVAVDTSGRVLTFNPAAPQEATPITLDPGGTLAGLACPSFTQCTTVDAYGRELTFNPGAPALASGTTVDPIPAGSTQTVSGVACPVTTQCTVVDATGQEVTFDPLLPHPTHSASLDLGTTGPVAIACASPFQCTAVDGSQQVTFDPRAPGHPRATTLDAGDDLIEVACPATGQCTAVDQNGAELTFNPRLPPASVKPVVVDSEFYNPLFGLACPSASQCTAVSGGGREITFNPQSPGQPAPAQIDLSPGGDSIGQLEGLLAVACPSLTTCTSVDGAGDEITFDPRAPGVPATVRIDSGNELLGVACPLRTECVAVDPDQQVTFDPLGARLPQPRRIFSDPGIAISGLACPTATRCTAVRGDQQLSFDPTGRASRPATIDRRADDGLSNVACPTARECVAIDAGGAEVSFNPATGRLLRSAKYLARGDFLVTLACASASQCTAVDDDGRMLTFVPRTGHVIATAIVDRGIALDETTGDSENELDGIACPSVRLCVAVDNLGNEVHFDPRSRRRATAATIDPGSALTAVACPSIHECVAVDLSGRALIGAPQSRFWAVELVPNAAPLSAITCPGPSECVAVDTAGDAFVGVRPFAAPAARARR